MTCRVAISIVLYRTVPHAFGRVLQALDEQEHRVDRLLVHVNAPGAGQLDLLNQVMQVSRLPWELTSTPENLGFSGGHNRCLAALYEHGVDAVVVHNPDLLLEPAAIRALVRAAASLAPAVLLGPALQLADPETLSATGSVDTLGIRWTRSGRHLDSSQGQPWQEREGPPERVAGISGACLYVPTIVYRQLVETTGEFFDADFLAYREDAELAFRAALIGMPSFLVPTARGRHARGTRGTTRGRDAHIDRLGVRNRFLLAAKYGRERPGGWAGPLLRDAVVLAGVVASERTSWPGVVDAWRLRGRMRAKGQVALRHATVDSRAATRLGL